LGSCLCYSVNNSYADAVALNDHEEKSWNEYFDPTIEIISAVQGSWGAGLGVVSIPTSLRIGFEFFLPTGVISIVVRGKASYGRFKFSRAGHFLPLNDIAIRGLNDEEDDQFYEEMDARWDILPDTSSHQKGLYLLDAAHLRIHAEKVDWMEWNIGVLNMRRWDRFNQGSMVLPVIGIGELGFLSPYFTRMAPINTFEHETIHAISPTADRHYKGKNSIPAIAFRLDPVPWFTFRGILTLPKLWYHLWVRNGAITEVIFKPRIAGMRGWYQLTWTLSDDHESQLHRMAYCMNISFYQEIILSDLYIFGRYALAERSGVQQFFGEFRYQWHAGVVYGRDGDSMGDYKHYWGAGVAGVAKIPQTNPPTWDKSYPIEWIATDPEIMMELFYRIHIFPYFHASLHYLRFFKMVNQYADELLSSVALRLSLQF